MKEHFEKYLKSISKKFSYEETSKTGYRKEFEILPSQNTLMYLIK
jgi:hypothetical protein